MFGLDHAQIYHQIKLVQPGEPIPKGYELITKSITGLESGQIKPLGFLALKRADTSSVMFIEGEPLIDDLCLVLQPRAGDDIEREDIPEDYQEVERCALTAPINVHPSAASSVQSLVSFIIGFHRRAAVGLCDLGYDSATLDRYPLQVRVVRLIAAVLIILLSFRTMADCRYL